MRRYHQAEGSSSIEGPHTLYGERRSRGSGGWPPKRFRGAPIGPNNCDSLIAAAKADTKLYRNGTHRQIAPAETLARIQPLLAKAGITRVANVTHLDRIGIPVFMVVRPNSRSLSVDQGKGLDAVSARVSGIMEAIERFHCETVRPRLKFASYSQQRRSGRTADPMQLARRKGGRFNADRPIFWAEGADVRSGEPTWLPYELVTMDYRLPRLKGSGCFITTRTGAAAGNHPKEALIHAICEIIERDAVTLWMLRGGDAQDRMRIDLDSVDDPACISVTDAIRNAGIDLVVWEITSDVGVPAFICQLVDQSDISPIGITDAGGSGCHPVKGIALLRALTEALQSRLTYISGGRDDLTMDDYKLPSKAAYRYRLDLLHARSKRRSFRAIPTYEAETLSADLDWLLERLADKGLEEVIAVDMKRPDFGIPVYRVIIPGLEDGFDTDGFLPGGRARRAKRGQL